MVLKFSTKKLPNTAGIAKFKIHINVVTVITVNSFKSVNPNSHTATEPFITHSKMVKLGMNDEIKYILKIRLINVK